MEMAFAGLHGWESTIFSFAILFLAVMFGLLIYSLAFHALERLTRSSALVIMETRLVNRWRGPARVILPLFIVMLVLPFLRFNAEILEVLRHVFSLCFISSIAWLIINTILAVQDIVLSRYDVIVHDNLKARTVHTQINVLVKILLVIIIVIAMALILMTFDRIRQVGMSILASAGIIGIIAGFAAQRSIATLFAGIQIAIAQPIRIDDVVIVEGEWGVIEEITLTYVVVRVWDLRRLVVPIVYFLEKPFQNWTWTSSKLIGTVLIYTDYTVPVNEVRQALHDILRKSPRWNGEAWALHVTNATDHTLELRALMSANDAGGMWELRCEVREKMIDFIRRRYPESLPRLRAVVEDVESEAGNPGTA